MLGADYFAQENGNPAPFAYTDITQKVNLTVAGSSAGSATETSYDAYFTTASSTTDRAGTVVCQFAGRATSGVPNCIDYAAVLSLLDGLGQSSCLDTTGLPTCAGLVAVTGVRVVPANTHPTLLESVIGIHQASEQATATSVFAFMNAAEVNYIVWWDCVYDPTSGVSTTGQITLGSNIVYFENNGLAKQQSCITTTASKFKGDIKSPWYTCPPSDSSCSSNPPNPLVDSPGWLQAYGGTGSEVVAESKGSTFLLPLVNCLFNANQGTVDAGTQCIPPYSGGDKGPYVDCGSSFSQPLGSGGVVMCIVGLVWVQAGNDCNVSGTTNICWGTVVSPPNNEGGVSYCEPSSTVFPNCGNTVGTAAIKPTIQLLQ